MVWALTIRWRLGLGSISEGEVRLQCNYEIKVEAVCLTDWVDIVGTQCPGLTLLYLGVR